MKMYPLSLGAGRLVGVTYSLLNVRSSAPRLVALVGPLGIPICSQAIPVAKQLVTGETLAAAWRQARCTAHMFGMLPDRQADVAAAEPLSKIVEKHS